MPQGMFLVHERIEFASLAGLSEQDTPVGIASWRDEDKQLEVYYLRSSEHILMKSFRYVPPDFPTENCWQRLVDWCHKVFR
jgi:hypothetical protein